MNTKPVVYTIGHSTHPFDEFVSMLEDFHIQKLVDVRTIPKSRFNPQFNKEILAKALASHKIAYEHMAGLGGLRHPSKDSLNTGWRNSSFRGYADYMQSGEFDKNLRLLMKEAEETLLAIMCAEAVPWRCHRSLIGDALLVHGFEVRNIMGHDKDSLHKLNPMARIKSKKVYYPKEAE